MDTVKQCLRSHPRNLTPNMSFDNGILGYDCINRSFQNLMRLDC